MAVLPFVHTGLKAFAAIWALITFAVAASLMAQLNDDFGAGEVNDTKFAAGNAIIAAGVLAFLYSTVVVILIVLTPESIIISLLVDTIVLSFLFIFFLASTATLSTEGHWFSRFDEYTEGKRGQATLALAWIMTFLILGILLLEVIYATRHYGSSWATWRTPFNQLLAYGSPGAGVGANTNPETGAGVGVPMGAVSHQPATTATTQPAEPTITPYPHTAPAPAAQAQAPIAVPGEKAAQV